MKFQQLERHSIAHDDWGYEDYMPVYYRNDHDDRVYPARKLDGWIWAVPLSILSKAQHEGPFEFIEHMEVTLRLLGYKRQ